jgi:hypothetical protein
VESFFNEEGNMKEQLKAVLKAMKQREIPEEETA